ncbi:MAG: hypothetical protein L0387_27340 [Acidobacteria bacterium]|nr:hypothetical protein [Acidobacteriota bacterium]
MIDSPFLSTRTVWMCVALMTALGAAQAQDVNNQLNIGLPPNGVFSGSAFDSVQLNNGNLHVEVPLASVSGRGLPVDFKLVYDNKGWYFITSCNGQGICTDRVQPAPGNNMAWRLAGPFNYNVTLKSTNLVCTPGLSPQSVKTNYVLQEPDGTKHHFLPAQLTAPGFETTTCPAYGSTLYADDGSGWIIKTDTNGFGSQAVHPNGTTIAFGYGGAGGAMVRDTSGNQLILQPSPNIPGVATDTLGRIFNSNLVFNSATGKWEFSYQDSSGAQQVVQITRALVPVQTALCVYSGADGCNEWTGNLNAITEVEFPNGMKYQFTYVQNSHGELSSANLPTGGQISWTWAPMDEGGRKVASRTVTANGQSSAWSYGTAGASVVDPLGNATRVSAGVFCQGNLLPHITKVENFQGSTTSGVLVKTLQTDYTTGATCVPIRETTTWNEQNLVNKTETDWDAFTLGTPVQTLYRRNPLQKREYAYGTGAAGALVRKTSFNYLHLVNTTYKNLNIVDRPTSKIVYDGASVIKAQTQWTYDGTTPLAASGAPNHDYTNFGTSYLTRGNATQVRNWLNTTGAWLATNNVYDELGNLRTSTDPGNHTTTYSYADDWANSACVPAGANTQAHVTQVTNHLGHRIQTRYFPCTSQVERTRDENHILASIWGRIFTYDQMHRTLTVVEADGGQTSFAYNDAAPVSVTTTRKITSSLNLVSTAIRDDLGQVKQTQLTSDPEGTVYTDTTYDALGRTSTVSNPYRSTGETTYGITETQYDALGRVTKVIPPDGTATSNNVTTTYAGPTTTVTDQAGKVRKSETDALGRLIRVWEPNSSGSLVNTTRYFYDTLDNLTCVLQLGAAAEPANCTSPNATYRPRTFTYNSLSQLLTAVNPESGTISYTYDPDGNVLTKVAPKPNQTGALTVTTTYSYDALHRLTQKSYNDGATATVKYAYDAVPLTTGCTTYPATLTITNGIGRRTAMCDASGATTWSYDPEGQPLQERRSLDPGTRDLLYTYNLDGSLASVNYTGRVVTYTPSGAGRTLSAIDLGDNVKYVTSALYAPHGSLSSMVSGYVAPTIFTGITTTNSYNNRLQPAVLSAAAPAGTVLSFSYNFDRTPGRESRTTATSSRSSTTATPLVPKTLPTMS